MFEGSSRREVGVAFSAVACQARRDECHDAAWLEARMDHKIIWNGLTMVPEAALF